MAVQDRVEQVREVAALWRAVTSRPLHPVGCTCMGHFLIPAMNPRDMEADILDYMRARYAAEGLCALTALLDRREVERDRTDIPARPFRAWLTALPATGTGEAELDRFLADLESTLRSFVPTGPAPNGLICT